MAPELIPDWVEGLIVLVVIVFPLAVAIFGYRNGKH